MSQRAQLLVIEGIDGSGKGTQSASLREHLCATGLRVASFSFPRYQETLFGQLVGEFLNGKYGTLDQVHPQLVALLFAGDRFESKSLLETALAENDVVLCDRYVPSNVAHQGAKRKGQEQTDLIRRILQIEYDVYALPRPDLVLLLDMPAAIAQQLIARKQARTYTSQAADIHEADAHYLHAVREVYLELAKREPGWQVVAGFAGERLKPVEEISAEIWKRVEAQLARPRAPEVETPLQSEADTEPRSALRENRASRSSRLP